jgi:hypothetical protein
MHEALLALVLDSKALFRTVMNETPTNQASSVGNSGAAPSTSDEQLMLAFSKGSSHAFEELFSRYKQPIFGFFRRRVTESAQAEELTQETFLALLRAATRYEPRALFRTYLYAIGFKILRTSSQSRFSRHVFRPT